MDIQRLRQILKELNPIFWNDKLERQLQEKNYTSHTPISSALGRYMVFLENNTKEEFDDILQKVVPCDTPQKERVDNLLEELKKCLSPFDKVYDVLRKEFTSSFAEQVLLTYEDRVRNYDNLLCKKWKDWAQLVVCMSHKDFRTTPLAKGPGTNAEDGGKIDTSKSLSEIIVLIDRIARWVIKWSKKLHPPASVDSQWANDVRSGLRHLNQILQPLDDLCFWLRLHQPELVTVHRI